MRFVRIAINNIRSYKDQEVIFPQGSLLLEGDVGAGKTSILLALEYALFGLQPGQKGASLLKNNEDTASVELEMEIKGSPVIIQRKLRRNPKGVSNEYAAITINGEKIESSITEIKSKIVELLGYPPEFIKRNNTLFRYTIYTPQEHMKQIILDDSQSRLNILRHIFGIEKYRRIRDNCAILTNNFKSEIKYLQGEISTLDTDRTEMNIRKQLISSLNESISKGEILKEQKRQKRKVIENECKLLEDKLAEKYILESEIEKTKVLIQTKHEQISSLQVSINELNESISQPGIAFKAESYHSLLTNIQKTKDTIDRINIQFMDISSQENSLSKQQEELTNKRKRIFEIDICPTCLQDVKELHKHNILNDTETKLSGISNVLNNLNKERTQLQDILQLKKQDLNQLEEEKIEQEIRKSRQEDLKQSKLKLQEQKKQQEALNKDLDILNKHIEALKGARLKFTSFENLFSQKQSELRESIKEERNTEISLAESKKEKELAIKELNHLETKIIQKEAAKDKMIQLTEFTDWLSNYFLNLVEFTERNVLLKVRNEFSQTFRKWFNMLITDSSLESQIDENFTPIILQGETEMEYDFLSGGERTAVALAYRLALNQTVNSVMGMIKTKGIIILDEPTDGFSDAQVDKIRDILEELHAEQLIIVSHESKIESFVDNVIKVSKVGNSSQIENALTQNPTFS